MERRSARWQSRMSAQGKLSTAQRLALTAVRFHQLNEVREKLGEEQRRAGSGTVVILTANAGWLHLDNTPLMVRIEPFLPKAFRRTRRDAGLFLSDSRFF